MKTVCSIENVACIVDNLSLSINGAFLPFAVVGFALIASYVIASILKGL
jgi:hypothetical protein